MGNPKLEKFTKNITTDLLSRFGVDTITHWRMKDYIYINEQNVVKKHYKKTYLKFENEKFSAYESDVKGVKKSKNENLINFANELTVLYNTKIEQPTAKKVVTIADLENK